MSILAQALAEKYREHFKVMEPYIPDILDSRIVDTNIDVPNPPTGWYARYANGLQIAMMRGVLGEPETSFSGSLDGESHRIYRYSKSYPAPFVDVYAWSAQQSDSLSWDRITMNTGASTSRLLIYTAASNPLLNYSAIVVGRWGQ